MIKKLRLKCHSLSNSASGYTLPTADGGRNGCLTSKVGTQDSCCHPYFETLCSSSNVPSDDAARMVSHYNPVSKSWKVSTEPNGKVEGLRLRSHRSTRLCHSDDDGTPNDTRKSLRRRVKSITLNSGSRYEEEETHMSWTEIMAKKRELEQNLEQEVEVKSSFLKQKNGKHKQKRCSFFSPSFKLKDFFTGSTLQNKQKKMKKPKSNPRLNRSYNPDSRSNGQTSSGDPSPVLFDLRNRGLPAIPLPDSANPLSYLLDDDMEGSGRSLLRVKEGSLCSRDSRGSRVASNSSSSCSSGDIFIDSFNELKNKGWYWGPLNWKEAEEQLKDKPTGSFLVRDSSDDRYILSLTFKSDDKIHHTRIEHYRGQFSFNAQPKSLGAATIVEFIEKAVENCADGSFSYFLRPRGPGIPPTMFRLVRPVSRFTKVDSLQHLCRFVILTRIRRDRIEDLPIPSLIQNYLTCAQYYVE